MKKFLIGCATAAMMLSPSVAEAGGRHGHGNDWIGPVIFGTVLGIIIGSNNHNHETVIRHHRRIKRDITRHHRRHNRRARSRWVEVCKLYPHTRRDRWGDYYVVMRHECRVVLKARW